MFHAVPDLMNRRRKVQEMMSAGGVVYRANGAGGIEVAICGRRFPSLRALPKGTPDPGETEEQTALREVREETGLEVVSEDYIDSIDYWFVRAQDGVRCHKVVHFYLMKAWEETSHNTTTSSISSTGRRLKIASGPSPTRTRWRLFQKGVSLVTQEV